jgi:hypothetical protein
MVRIFKKSYSGKQRRAHHCALPCIPGKTGSVEIRLATVRHEANETNTDQHEGKHVGFPGTGVTGVSVEYLTLCFLYLKRYIIAFHEKPLPLRETPPLGWLILKRFAEFPGRGGG